MEIEMEMEIANGLAIAAGSVFLLLGSSYGWGSFLLLPTARGSLLFGRWLTLGVGLGLHGILTLGLGTAGCLKPVLFWMATLLGWTLLLRGRTPLHFPLTFSRSDFDLWILGSLAVLASLTNLACFALPPVDYDVLEYHLGLPAEFLKTGRIAVLDHNVFSGFPLLMEMLYLHLRMLTGTWPSAAAAAHLLNGLLLLGAAGLTYAMGRRLFDPRTGAVAGALFLLSPWIFRLTANAYAEAGWIFFSLLGLGTAVECLRAPAPLHPFISGICCGLAFGCKYPALLFLMLPIAGCFLASGRTPRATPLYAAGCLLPMAPWLLRNLLETANPFYPLLTGWIPTAGWTEARTALFDRAHGVPSTGWSELWNSLNRVFWNGERAQPLLLLWLPFSLLDRKRMKITAVLLGYLLLVFLLWYRFTHRIERFLTPLLPTVALLAGHGYRTLRERAPRLKTVLLAASLFVLSVPGPWNPPLPVLWNDIHLSLGDMTRLSEATPHAWLRQIERENGQTPEYNPAMIERIDRLPRDEPVLLLGESQTFLLTRPILYHTVFDPIPLTPPWSPALQAADLFPEILSGWRRAGIRRLYVNWAAVDRLRDTYAYSLEGRRHPGYPAYIQEAAFEQAVIQGRLREELRQGPDHVLYRIP
jgi:hypothetical protein